MRPTLSIYRNFDKLFDFLSAVILVERTHLRPSQPHLPANKLQSLVMLKQRRLNKDAVLKQRNEYLFDGNYNFSIITLPNLNFTLQIQHLYLWNWVKLHHNLQMYNFLLMHHLPLASGSFFVINKNGCCSIRKKQRIVLSNIAQQRTRQGR